MLLYELSRDGLEPMYTDTHSGYVDLDSIALNLVSFDFVNI